MGIVSLSLHLYLCVSASQKSEVRDVIVLIKLFKKHSNQCGLYSVDFRVLTSSCDALLLGTRVSGKEPWRTRVVCRVRAEPSWYQVQMTSGETQGF